MGPAVNKQKKLLHFIDIMIESNKAKQMDSERITFKNHRGEVLTGDLYLPDNRPTRGVVFGHCFTCSRHTRIITESCQELYKTGMAALRFDFSGNGQSEGDFAETTYTKHVREMGLAITLLKQQGVQKIGLAGHSMGAAISLLTAADLPEVKAVCTLAGRYSGLDVSGLLRGTSQTELKQTGQMHFNSRGRSLVLTDQFFADVGQHDLSAVVSNLEQPLLAIHGDRDDIIPVEEVYHCRKQRPANSSIEVIEGADHMFSLEEHRIHVANLVTSWFKTQLQ